LSIKNCADLKILDISVTASNDWIEILGQCQAHLDQFYAGDNFWGIIYLNLIRHLAPKNPMDYHYLKKFTFRNIMFMMKK